MKKKSGPVVFIWLFLKAGLFLAFFKNDQILVISSDFDMNEPIFTCFLGVLCAIIIKLINGAGFTSFLCHEFSLKHFITSFTNVICKK